jgi:small subunit ribosomal protein S7
MPRKGKVKRRPIEKDPIYKDKLVTKLINRSMVSGKKTIARKHIYNAFKIIKEEKGVDPKSVFDQAMDNLRPQVEVRSRRVGGAAYQVPMPVRGPRQNSLAIRWLVKAARERPNKQYHSYAEKLAAEIIDASEGQGAAFTKKQQVERTAEANKAFSHLRW